MPVCIVYTTIWLIIDLIHILYSTFLWLLQSVFKKNWFLIRCINLKMHHLGCSAPFLLFSVKQSCFVSELFCKLTVESSFVSSVFPYRCQSWSSCCVECILSVFVGAHMNGPSILWRLWISLLVHGGGRFMFTVLVIWIKQQVSVHHQYCLQIVFSQNC